MKYTDPSGMFSFDSENNTINCNLTDYEDVSLASTQFVLNENRGYNKCVATDEKTGTSITFNDAKSMVSFVEENTDEKSYLGTLASLVSLASVYCEKQLNSKALNGLVNGLSVSATLLDLNDSYQDFAKDDTYNGVDKGIDFVLYIVGFAGPPPAPL